MNASNRPPAIVIALAGAAVLFVALPFAGLLGRAPWSSLLDEYGDPSVREALLLSIQTALAATAVSLVLGVPLAWVLARARLPATPVIRALVLLPMLLTPVVGGAGLLYALGPRRGLVGPWLYEHTGLLLPFTWRGVVIAQAFVAMPFLVITVEAALRAADPRFEEAAATLGAGRWMRFRRVTLPLVAPSVAAGAVLCWARALGEFGATVTFNGNLEGAT
ncbi:MAG: ABC transporter permease subunit, partial [Chloroflexi bacterium]|nr:ABC transporter permease subunit [Chloroflexota bacterium]